MVDPVAVLATVLQAVLWGGWSLTGWFLFLLVFDMWRYHREAHETPKAERIEWSTSFEETRRRCDDEQAAPANGARWTP